MKQLSLFNSGTKTVPEDGFNSGTQAVPDAQSLKRQAIERYLRGSNKNPIPHIETYSPSKSNREYRRLVYRLGSKLKKVHICGGSTLSDLANYRASKIQAMIDRGAELEEILAALKTFNSGN